jgi:tetratricopeptide (TPR) repeat protein
MAEVARTRHAGSVANAKGPVFISHAGEDRAWAEWVAWHLTEAGYSIELDSWDWSPGEDFVEHMAQAMDGARIMVSLWSVAYFANTHTRRELQGWLAGPDDGRRLVCLRLEQVEPPRLYASRIRADLFDRSDEDAVTVLLTATDGAKRPTVAPQRPARGQSRDHGPRIPGSLPSVFKAPPRNPNFTGREPLLRQLRERLMAGERTVVQALHGMGGVGKTQLAVEHAHRFAGDYDLVWWIDSERPDLIGEQMAALAVAAGVVTTATAVPDAVAALEVHLRTHARWLLVFDNVERPEDVLGRLPAGPGHVLLTSRHRVWAGVAAPVEVDVFDRAESVELIRSQAPGVSEADAARIAELVGDLPLAVAQAGGVLAQTGMPVALYVTALTEQTVRMLNIALPAHYPVPLGVTVRIALDKLGIEDEAALELIRICAFLAPEPVPLLLFTGAPSGSLPDALAAAAADPPRLYECVAALGRFGLARVGPDGPTLHRLTQTIVRDSMTDSERAGARTCAEGVVVDATPDRGDHPRNWPLWARLTPHLLALGPAASDNVQLREAGTDVVFYLLAHGDARAAKALGEDLYESFRARLGADSGHVLWAAMYLATTLRALGELERARELDEEALTRCRRVFGDDHPSTLTARINLAITLHSMGHHDRARELAEDVLHSRRRVRGDDHPDTLRSATIFANTLYSLGEYDRARDIEADTLARCRRVLGHDYPDTLGTAHNLAMTLCVLGEYGQARDMFMDTLTRRRRVLGDDHPDTLVSADSLVGTLRELGEHERAQAIEAEFAEIRRRNMAGSDRTED